MTTRPRSRRQERERKPPYYLITGAILGLVFGLIFSLVIVPARVVNTLPENLNDLDKDKYRIMVAYAYQEDQDVGRAIARLSLLGDGEITAALSYQAEKILRTGENAADAQVLSKLSEAIFSHYQLPGASPLVPSEPDEEEGQNPAENPEEESYDPETSESVVMEEEEPNNNSSAVKTPTPQGSSESEPVIIATSQVAGVQQDLLASAFKLTGQETICDPDENHPEIRIQVVDSEGNPLSGIPVEVMWENGQEVFYTGLHPYQNEGYADFSMQSAKVYAVRAGSQGEIVTDISVPQCSNDVGGEGSIALVFTQP